jgi:serine/threonine protein kinase
MDTSFRPGDVVDYYHLDSLVATTAMATLFRATDTRNGSRVAVKVGRSLGPLNRLFGTVSAEARIGRKLNHPGIARTLSDTGAGRGYAVMEWAEGWTLRQIISDHGALPSERSIEIVLHVCQVLEYIHEQGIAHLDLKPENVIVRSDNTIKLIDFGLARDMRRGFSSLLAPKAKGTPDYASPEQIRGKPGDGRSDIYSLGLMLYEMLTGEVPFSGVALGAALQLRVLSDPLPPEEINPNVTPEVSEVVLRAIARDPAKRQASAREFSAELEHIRCAVPCELAGSI